MIRWGIPNLLVMVTTLLHEIKVAQDIMIFTYVPYLQNIMAMYNQKNMHSLREIMKNLSQGLKKMLLRVIWLFEITIKILF